MEPVTDETPIRNTPQFRRMAKWGLLVIGLVVVSQLYRYLLTSLWANVPYFMTDGPIFYLTVLVLAATVQVGIESTIEYRRAHHSGSSPEQGYLKTWGRLGIFILLGVPLLQVFMVACFFIMQTVSDASGGGIIGFILALLSLVVLAWGISRLPDKIVRDAKPNEPHDDSAAP